MAEEGDGALPWGIEASELKSDSLSTISKKKLSAFEKGQMGTVTKKTPFQLKKEAEERKKIIAEQEAAQAYEEFVKHYAAPEPTSKTFLREGGGDREYRGDRDRHRGDRDRRERDYDRRRSPPPPAAPPPTTSSSKKGGKKLSNMELFKQQIQRDQREREARRALKQAREGGNSAVIAPLPPTAELGGSFDTGDPSTTNLYVGNLAPNMNEHELCKLFGRYGPLASVKIMWPRTQDEKTRGRLCGFVAFMTRKDGEACLAGLSGKMVMDYEIKLGWGKPVALPPTPFYVHAATAAGKRVKTGLPFNATPAVASKAGPAPMLTAQQARQQAITGATVIVVIPSDRAVRQLIHRTIEFVVREGPEFEAALMKKVEGDPKYKFLSENDCFEHTYYRWKLFSVLQGDRVDRWGERPFRMFEGGSLWEPPDRDSLKLTEEVEKGHLSHEDRDKLEKLLRTITPERKDIARLMVFCIGHADAAAEVVDCITESLTILETPIPIKAARLYLVSDILHNCTAHVRNASSYRILIEAKLPAIFKALHATFHAIGGRLRAENFRKNVVGCLNAWRDWNVFPPDRCEAFETIFQAGASADADDDDIDGVPLAPSSAKTSSASGGAAAMEEDEDLDGVPLAPSNNDGLRPGTKRVASKWENDESDSDDQGGDEKRRRNR